MTSKRLFLATLTAGFLGAMWPALAQAEGPQMLLSRTVPANATPMGFEVGYSNFAGVRKALGTRIPVIETGINTVSGGKMMSTGGDGYPINNLLKVTYIFDRNDVLVALVLSMPRNPVEAVSILSAKYKMLENKVSGFNNYGTAKFEQGDSFVVLEAPKMAYAMDIHFIEKAFYSRIHERKSET